MFRGLKQLDGKFLSQKNRVTRAAIRLSARDISDLRSYLRMAFYNGPLNIAESVVSPKPYEVSETRMTLSEFLRLSITKDF